MRVVVRPAQRAEPHVRADAEVLRAEGGQRRRVARDAGDARGLQGAPMRERGGAGRATRGVVVVAVAVAVERRLPAMPLVS